ncbi:helix-turn-helix transcriptional regulator [Roseateles sp. DAIF2]|uniref:helix-turn-helix transcriptional regulator n=1 Tax=Roseateles sp. DAIF2 TaxID=2714952 RepID=UPI0018A26C5A|nr:helix-turn-helix transcriptional regulator [Roseateles sp. DAIF2]QPF74218.1 helix-turn-helix transcriptional regulator [Roseateles sp. DAIF2]
MSVQERFKAERERLRLTQPQAADLTGVGKTTVINWEKGLSSPTAVQLAELAKAGMDVLYVITGDHAGGVSPAPTLSAEEQTMLDYFRDASKEVRRAALGALLGAPAVMKQVGGSHSQHNSGAGSVQIGTMESTPSRRRK